MTLPFGPKEAFAPVLSERVERLLPYSPKRLFDLAADVERYPDFLRWWIAARIQKREAGVYYTHQVLGFGPIRVSFGSKTMLRRPERIDVTSDKPPFRELRLSWIFESRPGHGCRVSLVAECQFRSYLLERVVAGVLPTAIADTMLAFETRARQLYGDRDADPG
jgi:coenzyme Q-binding protein COQ10